MPGKPARKHVKAETDLTKSTGANDPHERATQSLKPGILPIPRRFGRTLRRRPPPTRRAGRPGARASAWLMRATSVPVRPLPMAHRRRRTPSSARRGEQTNRAPWKSRKDEAASVLYHAGAEDRLPSRRLTRMGRPPCACVVSFCTGQGFVSGVSSNR